MTSGMQQVLFLCSGNYYRSRHAEIYFNWQAERSGLAWRALSRGLALSDCNVGPLSTHTRSRLAALSIPWEPYARMPMALAEGDLKAADVVVAVKAAEHRAMVEALFPVWMERIEFWQIDDLDCATPAAALPELESQVARLLERLAAVAGSTAA